MIVEIDDNNYLHFGGSPVANNGPIVWTREGFPAVWRNLPNLFEPVLFPVIYDGLRRYTVWTLSWLEIAHHVINRIRCRSSASCAIRAPAAWMKNRAQGKFTFPPEKKACCRANHSCVLSFIECNNSQTRQMIYDLVCIFSVCARHRQAKIRGQLCH